MKKKIKQADKLIAGSDIKLSGKVVVSDPCYSIPTWCQGVLSNVKSGTYKTFVLQTDEGEWGIRNSRLFAVHQDYLNTDLNWESLPYDIGVDSGQAGIFTLSSYRNDKFAEKMEYKKEGQWFGLPLATEEGDLWYEKTCGMTINNDEGFGTYSNGVVSRSGIGDGGYGLYGHFIKEKGKNKLVALCIDFLLSESKIKSNFNE